MFSVWSFCEVFSLKKREVLNVSMLHVHSLTPLSVMNCNNPEILKGGDLSLTGGDIHVHTNTLI